MIKYDNKSITDILGDPITVGDFVVIARGGILEIGRIVNASTTTIHLKTLDDCTIYPHLRSLYSHRIFKISKQDFENARGTVKDRLQKDGRAWYDRWTIGVT